MTTIHEPDVDALDVDAPAAVQLDIDAQRAGLSGHSRIVRPNGGPTAIRFDSRADFEAWADFGLIYVNPNPYLIVVDATEVHVPVTFGWPYAWNAVAIYPTQESEPADILVPTRSPDGETIHVYSTPIEGAPAGSAWGPADLRCHCEAELVHMAGCPLAVDVIVIDLPRRTPGAALVHELLPNECDGFGALTCDLPFTGNEPASTDPAQVTCPDCLRYIPADNPPSEKCAHSGCWLQAEPGTAHCRSHQPEVRALASALVEETSGTQR